MMKPFQDGIWVSSSEYALAEADPLRNSAEKIVDEINTNNREDVFRFCNIYVELDFQVRTPHHCWLCIYFHIVVLETS